MPTSASASNWLKQRSELLKTLFGDKYLSEKVRDKCTRPWSCPLCSIAAKFGPFEKICFSDFGAFTTVVPAVCVASASPSLSAIASLPKASFAVWASWQGLEQGRAGPKPGCFSHEPGATRAGPGARFRSTREAQGRAGCMFQQNPARSRVHPPG